MRRKPGSKASNIRLRSLDGSAFELDSLEGTRFMLAFFRFAACPFCNLRIHELVTRHGELGNNFTIVAVFDSSLQNLQNHAVKHHAPFPILADEHNVYHQEYGIEHSALGTLKGAITRMPSVLNAIFVRGYFPTSIKGRLTTMPANFLIDENGVIHTAHYGKDEGDHLPFETVKAFALREKTGTKE
jgi:peroxiredoxin